MSTDTDQRSDRRQYWQEWLGRWDAQQTGYIPDREARFELMLDLVEAQVGSAPVILDLACGPGSISERALRRFPNARSIAVDADPALVHMGRQALGDADGRLTWIQADLRTPDWVQSFDAALADLGAEHIDAVLSATATHWLSPGDLGPIYAAIRPRLRPGGIYVNADHMPASAEGTLAAAVESVRTRRRDDRSSAATDAETWEAWWEALADDPEVGPEIAGRDRIGSGHHDVPTAADHIDALRAAGFDDVRTITQEFDSRILAAG